MECAVQSLPFAQHSEVSVRVASSLAHKLCPALWTLGGGGSYLFSIGRRFKSLDCSFCLHDDPPPPPPNWISKHVWKAMAPSVALPIQVIFTAVWSRTAYSSIYIAYFTVILCIWGPQLSAFCDLLGWDGCPTIYLVWWSGPIIIRWNMKGPCIWFLMIKHALITLLFQSITWTGI